MKFSEAIDIYIAERSSQGRLNSESSRRGYRSTLDAHREDVGNRDPRYINREDVKRTLRRWAHPNTQRTNRSKLLSFYDWLVEEGYRKDNPARQTPKPKRRPDNRPRLTSEETVAILEAVSGTRETRAIYLLACAGLRNSEVRGLQGRHFLRDGVIEISADIAKGGRSRPVPVLTELVPVVTEIRENVRVDEYVLPAQRFRNPPFNTERMELAKRPSSTQALLQLVIRVAKRSGVSIHVTPHRLRHAYADHIARGADTHVAQHLLGHANIGTTEIYLAKPRLDDMIAAVRDVTYGVRTNVLGVAEGLKSALEATTGIEPV